MWTLVRKPLEAKTIVDNVLKYGTGGINIDAVRVSTSDKVVIKHYTNEDIFMSGVSEKKSEHTVIPSSELGRYPANLLHDGSQEITNLFPHTKSGKMGPQHTRTTDGSPHGIYGKFNAEHPLAETIGDEGSASRFFNELETRDELINHLETIVKTPSTLILKPRIVRGE